MAQESRVDGVRIVAVIGFVLALVAAIFLFTQQQQAQQAAQAAQTQAAAAEDGRGTAVALADAASGAQVQAEAGQATAQTAAELAGTAQAESDAARGTAQADAQIAGTQAAQMMATSTINVGDAQATAQSAQQNVETAQAESQSSLATVQAQLDAQTTSVADTLNLLATATAQIDLAEFGRESAEEDRQAALEQAWMVATALANSEAQLSTAQAALSGATSVPTLAPTSALANNPTPAPTGSTSTVNNFADGAIPPLTETFTNSNGAITFKYPQGWAAIETQNGSIFVADSENTLQDDDLNVLDSGQFISRILVTQITNVPGLQSGATAAEVMNVLLTSLASGENPPEMSPAESVSIASYDAQRSSSKGSSPFAITVAMLDNDIVVVTYSSSAERELDFYLQAIDSIVETITVQVP